MYNPAPIREFVTPAIQKRTQTTRINGRSQKEVVEVANLRGKFKQKGTSELNAIRFQLSDEEKMRLKGRIDRIDTYETEDKVYVRARKDFNKAIELLPIRFQNCSI